MTVEALQDALAAEHAAVWVYALLGGRTSRAAEPALYDDVHTAYRVHRGRRDQLISVVADAGAEPIAAEVGYQLPAVDTPARVVALARRTEQRCAATYADLVARTEGAQRGWAIRALTDAAVRQLRFRGSPETFPGAGELTDR
jgi:hypothetical protein